MAAPRNSISNGRPARRSLVANEPNDGESTPICRCRVLYLGSAVPHVTKDGLQGIQEPLRELYPDQGAMGAKGIDSWLSVWSNGLLLENVDENHKRVTRFFPIESLHYCAAVRYVLVPAVGAASASLASPSGVERIARFLPLDSPFARQPNINHPPLFACIMRRTTGIKVLECHVFICKRETAANALVRCCFHAYADSTYAHHLENGGLPGLGPNGNLSPTAVKNKTPAPNGTNGAPAATGTDQVDGDMTLNSIEKVQGWRLQQQQGGPLLNGAFGAKNGLAPASAGNNNDGNGSTSSSHGMGSASVSMLILENGSDDDGSIINNGDSNHKVWTPSQPPERTPISMYGEYGSSNTMRSVRSSVSTAGATRSSRPRQLSAAAPPPPPPVVLPGIEESREPRATAGSKKKDARKGPSSHSRALVRGEEMEDLASEMGGVPSRRPSSVFNFPINGHRPPTIGALHPLPGHPGLVGYPVFSGRAGPSRGPQQPPMPPPPAYLVPVPMAVPVGGKKSKSSGFKFGTFSARGKKSKGGAPLMFLPPPPPHAGPIGHGPVPAMAGPPMLAAPAPMALGMPVPLVAPPLSMRRSSSRMTLSAEEPIYMPAAVRPISPIASYQPGHFPHEAYLMQQQYGGSDLMTTLPRHGPLASKADSKSKNKKNKNKDSKVTARGLDEGSLMGDGVDVTEESSVVSHSAGIYRKGHINERAFSYSIRQEHRSRSYSSLANYPTGGEHLDLRERDKKERELIQMVHDLDLSGDDLERSEVPIAMYPQHRQPR